MKKTQKHIIEIWKISYDFIKIQLCREIEDHLLKVEELKSAGDANDASLAKEAENITERIRVKNIRDILLEDQELREESIRNKYYISIRI